MTLFMIASEKPLIFLFITAAPPAVPQGLHTSSVRINYLVRKKFFNLLVLISEFSLR
jgi:hypothetical protein